MREGPADLERLQALDELRVACGNRSVGEWPGDGVYLRMEPTSLFTFARDPARFGS